LAQAKYHSLKKYTFQIFRNKEEDNNLVVSLKIIKKIFDNVIEMLKKPLF